MLNSPTSVDEHVDRDEDGSLRRVVIVTFEDFDLRCAGANFALDFPGVDPDLFVQQFNNSIINRLK